VKKARFALTIAPALLGALALAPAAHARVTVTVGRAKPVAVHSAARLGARTALPVDKGARRRPRAAGAAPRAAIAPPRVTRSAVTAVAAPTIRPNFNGVSSLDSAVTNFGQEFEPPDQGLCVSSRFVVEMVNSAYTIYNRSGAKLAGPFNINGPFDEGLREFTTDPRCYYDATTNTWFATILFVATDADGNFTGPTHLDIAVNNSGDPRTLWRNYQIDTTNPGAPPEDECPCFPDQPKLGIDSQNLYVTTDDFSTLGFAYNGDSIYAIAKQDLVNEVAAPHFAHFGHLAESDGFPATAVQPAITTGSSNAEFFLNSLDPFVTGDNRIDVRAMTNRGAVALGKAPTLSRPRQIVSEAYFLPPPADQKGTASTLDSGSDERMQQVQYINGQIWGELGTAVTIAGDPIRRAGAAWFHLVPGTGGGLAGTRIVKQGYVAVKGNHLIYPSVQQMPDGHAVMAFTYSGRYHFPSTAFSVLAPGASAFGPVHVTGYGTTHYDPFASRWGDYSWSILDPGGKAVWSAAEYVPPASSQTPDRAANWGTRVWQVRP
jgi:hypothetical protein